jgi:hypothetical protein
MSAAAIVISVVSFVMGRRTDKLLRDAEDLNEGSGVPDATP